ncbi:glycoside hydrolase/deacetylase [Lactarius akahatsu]|uniref:chitin deacetylase n=1 Tax=Lactarius akahatsu TaxID=416441 RepID=A0AAD4LPB3_9AGAM|nr:glycoside hydrolase/deacetylase [Lactarius akahatsu]
MKLTAVNVLSVASLPVIVLAHARHPNPHNYRQVLAASPSSSSPLSSSSGTPASGTVVSTTLLPTPTGSTPSISLQSTNPTAVPLSNIVVNAPSAATSIMPSPAPPGTTPSNIPKAPGLPNISTLSPGNYPPLDRPPPTDSPEVQQWIKEVQESGVEIPDFSPTVAGGCPANPDAVADSSRCWWTCGGCTRETDVTTCPQKYNWGLTYDDGPAPYTPDLLNYLDQVKLSATFFVVGSRVISYPALLQQEYLKGHQIAVHTWSHYSLTTLSTEEIIAEFGWTKKVIKDVLGVTPTMMRPPIRDRVRAICEAMNLIPVMWTRISPTATFDTDDFNIHGGVTNVQQVLYNWENILGNVSTIDTGFIVLEHDLFQQTVEVATGYILPDALAHQPSFKIQPVVECLDLQPGDAYLETNDNSTNPLPISSDGNSTNSTSSSSGQSSSGSGSGNTKNGALTGAVMNIGGLAVTVVLGVLAITL